MENNDNNLADKMVETIPFESEITIKVSGKFNARLQELYFFLAKQKSLEEFSKTLERLKSSHVDVDDYDAAIRTVHGLVTEISSSAREQGCVKNVPASEVKFF